MDLKNEDLFDFIERYFNNQLSPEERKKFEELQDKSPQFKEQIKNYRRIQDFMDYLDVERLNLQLNQESPVLSPRERERLKRIVDDTRYRIPLPKILVSAAAIILLIIVFRIIVPSLSSSNLSSPLQEDESQPEDLLFPVDPPEILELLSQNPPKIFNHFHPDTLREMRVYSSVMSNQTLQIISPKNKAILQDTVQFQWANLRENELIITLYNNQGDILLETALKKNTEEFKLDESYQAGRYYWQLAEARGQVVHMGVFFIL